MNALRRSLAVILYHLGLVVKHDLSVRGSGGELCWRATRQGIPGWKLIETMAAGADHKIGPPPVPETDIGSIDFPCLKKLIFGASAKAAQSGAPPCSSNSTGVRYPSAECSRRRL